VGAGGKCRLFCGNNRFEFHFIVIVLKIYSEHTRLIEISLSNVLPHIVVVCTVFVFCERLNTFFSDALFLNGIAERFYYLEKAPMEESHKVVISLNIQRGPICFVGVLNVFLPPNWGATEKV